MIKVAIPIFLDRISPRLDCARRMIILEIEKNRLVDKRELDISHWLPDEKIIQLRQLGIGQLICGGIRDQDRMGLNQFGNTGGFFRLWRSGSDYRRIFAGKFKGPLLPG